jgi:hypothetical protein
MADFAGRRGGRRGSGEGATGRGAFAERGGPQGRGASPFHNRGPSAHGRGAAAGRLNFRGGRGGGRGGFRAPLERSNVVSLKHNMIMMFTEVLCL